MQKYTRIVRIGEKEEKQQTFNSCNYANQKMSKKNQFSSLLIDCICMHFSTLSQLYHFFNCIRLEYKVSIHQNKLSQRVILSMKPLIDHVLVLNYLLQNVSTTCNGCYAVSVRHYIDGFLHKTLALFT